jgi:predicted DNA-binding transcriptional regulator YafY
MTEPLERLTNLLALLLETREPLTLKQIAAELRGQYPDNEVAMRGTFERDKSVLRDVGVPIEQEVLGGDRAGQTAYRIDRHRYELRGLDLTEEERRALQLAVAAVRSGESWGQEGLWKLGAGGRIPAASVATTLPASPVLPALREAIATRSPVSFDYRGARRTLDPYGLLLRESLWYVIGHDHGHDSLRTYRVDRIEGAPRAGAAGSFERPSGLDLRTVFPSDPKLLGDPAAGERARVRIDAGRAALVEGEVGETAVLERRPDGSIDVAVPFANRDAFRSWLLGLTDHAVVLEPEELRADIVAWLTAMAGAS